MSFNEKYNIIDRAEMSGVTVEILELSNLDGASSPDVAANLYFAKQAGLKARMVRILLNQASVKTEAGALYYSKGKIQSDTKIGGVSGFIKKNVSGALTGESMMKPTYTGSGELNLEPSFSHYFIVKLNGASVTIDDGAFYCCTNSLRLAPVMQKTASAAVLGNESLFQLQVSGTGLLVLEIPVPKDELVKYDLHGNEELKVDGNFAIIRDSNVKFSVTKSQKSLIKSAMGGEGFFNTYTGTGSVWLAPTAPIYRKFITDPYMGNSNNNSLE